MAVTRALLQPPRPAVGGESPVDLSGDVRRTLGVECGLRWCRGGEALVRLYAKFPRLRRRILKYAVGREGGVFYSATLRAVLRQHHGVEVGAYSYGECLKPGHFPAGVTVGRFVSIADGVKVFLRNHPMERLSMHPFFYNTYLGLVSEDTVSSGTLTIGHDAWIGADVMITPGCRRVGIGVVVGAGAVVTRDVPDFAVVAGNPGRVLRYRFDEPLRRRILESRWWERPIEEISPFVEHMVQPLGGVLASHPLLATT